MLKSRLRKLEAQAAITDGLDEIIEPLPEQMPGVTMTRRKFIEIIEYASNTNSTLRPANEGLDSVSSAA